MIVFDVAASTPTAGPRWARAPFYFNSSAHVMRIGRERASSLAELIDGLRSCPEDSIFQHTFQTLHEHHFLREGFSNDFAHWAFSACNEIGLAERLASIDVREFTDLAALRRRLVEVVEDYVRRNPRSADRAAQQPFYFCASDTVVIPTSFVARSLPEFTAALGRVSLHSLHHHFIEARLRLKLNSNDFSIWLEDDLDLGALAARINRIDIYTATLADVRERILRILGAA
jgi:uncharacterized protein DUF5752